MNKYWLIVIGAIFFVFVMAALAVFQSKQAKPTVIENETASNAPIDKVGTLALTVVQPRSGVTVKSAQILVLGKTTPNADVFVNDKDTVADVNGNFSVAFTLEEGENYILVGANDAQGNFSEREISVTYSF